MILIRDILLVVCTIEIFACAFLHFIPLIIIYALTHIVNRNDLKNWAQYDVSLIMYLISLKLNSANGMYTLAIFAFTLLCIDITLKTYIIEMDKK